MGHRAGPRRTDNDYDFVTIRLRTNWSLSALFMIFAILLGMHEHAKGELLIELAGRSYKAVIGQTPSHQDFLASGMDNAGHCEAGTFCDSVTKKSYGPKNHGDHAVQRTGPSQ